MRANRLVVLDPGPASLRSMLAIAWDGSGLRERLERLGEVVVWGTDVADARGLTERLRASAADTLVLVEGTQLFLDVALVERGLEAFDPAFHDVFTQWEHCRLPVGVGVRALAARAWFELDAATPEHALALVREAPAGRRFCYDVAHRTSFEDSLLDARWTPSLDALLADRDVDGWDLAGFLSLGRGDEQRLRYVPAEAAARVDARRMPAAYGFESDACAAFPTYVMFDVTNLCNARCVHCPQSLRGEDGEVPEFLRAKEHQSLESFRRVVDECAQHEVNFVRITADGEPLVHPHLFEMLEYARDKGVGPVGLTTNASLLTEERARRLLDSGVAMVDFSLDAAHEETFRRIRVGLSFQRTIANVERFLALRDAAGSDVRVVVSFVKQEANLDEVDAFRAYWEPRVDEVVVREMISNVGLNTPSENLWPGWDARWPCAHFFRRVVVNHQGLLKACPIDWEQRTVHRHVDDQSVAAQWHSDFYWSHRMQHLNDRIEEASACKRCPDWAGTPWDLGYEKIVQRLVATEEAAA